MIAFGPVPSRRLGRSVGINNIPPKRCTYSCVYCQVGRTLRMQLERSAFYEPQSVFRDVQDKVERAAKAEERVDYLTFVPDGEPTLDANLAQEIELLRPLGIKIAVITNGSLMGRADVREALMTADWVSLKVDAARDDTWRRVNRPHGQLQLAAIREGMLDFARVYPGELATETMLVDGVNDAEGELEDVADFLACLRPDVVYLSIPTRPPAEAWARVPDERSITRAYQILRERIEVAGRVECLFGYEGTAFAFTGDVEQDLLSITAVHPMREDAVSEFLARADAEWAVIRELIEREDLIETEYEGRKFYLRNLRRGRDGP